MLRTLLADPAIRSCTSIRHLSCGAEPLTPELVAAARQIFPDCPIYNEYGPTEATIVTAATTIPPGTTPAHIPIGCGSTTRSSTCSTVPAPAAARLL